ncbi:MAG: DmsC/YnfH family molybdoenzyme membrane anchor subunit [Acidimicrobiales bacterium]
MSAVTTPIDEFLRRQQDMSAVEHFATLHDAGTVDLHAGWYRTLLPASPPGPGQQYRFEVDMDACTACKACVSACHSLNGLDDDEAWRSVGTIAGFDTGGPTQQTVTTACHHCVEPACLEGCPVDAYDKDPITGIVAHLDDQCIGCSYCTWTCPYDVPVFNERLGVVRKCDMCRGRLAEGEAPACVQACPNGAIAIGVVDVDDARELAAPGTQLVPGAADSALTTPTTVYRRRDPLTLAAQADDDWLIEPGHHHTPLVGMLVATQVAVGATAATAVALVVGGAPVFGTTATLGVASTLTLGGIAASVGHLGRPLQAWRAVLGVGHSWLSREIVAFGAFAPAAVAATVTVAAPAAVPIAAVPITGPAATSIAGALGLAAVGCSAMIYIFTGRSWWAADRTASAFAITTLVGAGLAHPLALAAAAAVALANERRLDATAPEPSASIARGPLAPVRRRSRRARLAAGALGLAAAAAPAGFATGALLGAGVAAAVVGEVAERSVFFQAMRGPRMPGKNLAEVRKEAAA